MFLIKKIIRSFITIPGVIVLYLLISGIYGYRKKIKVLQINLFLGIIIYCISISPVADFLVGIIEKESVYDGQGKPDIIILLGGGIIEGARDLSGTGILPGDMTARVVDAVRLNRKYKLPVLISGGPASDGEREAVVARRYLIDLGVKPGDIIIEDNSRDTVENAVFVKRIFDRNGYKKGLLLTSAYHIRRAEYIFKNEGLNVILHSAAPLSKKKNYHIFDFIPDVEDFRKSAIALKEAVGILFYFFKYLAV